MPNCVTTRRLARFTISTVLLEQLTDRQCHDLFSHFVILRAEHRYDLECFEYTAASPLFAPVALGGHIPKYDIVISRNEKGKRAVTATPYMEDGHGTIVKETISKKPFYDLPPET